MKKFCSTVKPKLFAFLTYDLELFESSVVSQPFNKEIIIEEILEPLKKQVKWIVSENINITIFIEINQAKIINFIFPEVWEKIKILLDFAKISEAISFGLHVHPNWDERNGCYISNNRVVFGNQTYNYVLGIEGECISEWMAQFEKLTGYLPTSFRAGKYRNISNSFISALCDHGIKLLSSSIQGSFVAADNGDLFNYLDVSVSKPILRKYLINQSYWEVPVTARNGMPLSIDYMSKGNFEYALKALASEGTSICLVSHQKDISGGRFNDHCAKIELLLKCGFVLLPLESNSIQNLYENTKLIQLKFDSDSLVLLNKIFSKYLILESTMTPFPSWFKYILTEWSKNRKIEGANILTLKRIFLERGNLKNQIHVEFEADTLRIIYSGVGSSSWRYKFYVRRLYLMLPRYVRKIMTELFLIRQSMWQAEINFTKYLKLFMM